MIKQHYIEDYEVMNRYIISRIKTYRDVKVLGYSSKKFDIWNDFKDMQCIGRLRNLFIESALEYIDRPDVDYILMRGWIHIDWVDRTGNHSHRIWHDHIDNWSVGGGEGLTCVYYVDTSYEINGEAVLQYEHKTRGLKNIKSKSGQMVIFSNHISHSAKATKSSEKNPRYSISTNIRYIL